MALRRTKQPCQEVINIKDKRGEWKADEVTIKADKDQRVTCKAILNGKTYTITSGIVSFRDSHGHVREFIISRRKVVCIDIG